MKDFIASRFYIFANKVNLSDLNSQLTREVIESYIKISQVHNIKV